MALRPVGAACNEGWQVIHPIDTSILDPGIRNVVSLLRSWQYQTTDSGDGRTKDFETDSCALPFAHVHIVVEPPALFPMCDLLHHQLTAIGVEVVPEADDEDAYAPGQCTIEGVYLVGAGVAVITVARLDDHGLAVAQGGGLC